MNHSQDLSLIDLFAGCGGLSLGLEMASFTPRFVSELNSDAMESYLMNRRARCPWLDQEKCYDIKEMVANGGKAIKALKRRLAKAGIDDVDLVAGGPPCQGYSGIGHRRSYSVDKKQLPSNHLYQDMAYLVHLMNPKMFLFENVRGLLNAKWDAEGAKGEIWKDVLATFKAIPGYDVDHALVYAKDYGVPQNRPRVLMVGIRRDIGFKLDDSKVASGLLPQPTGYPPSIEEIFSDLVDDQYTKEFVTRGYPRPATNTWQRYFRKDPEHPSEAFKKGQPLTEQEYSKHSDVIVAKFRHMIENGGTIPDSMRTKKFAQRLLPKKWGDDGPSITATSLPDDYVHYAQPRSLTVREWARLQTFPDWYQFAGKRTTGGLRRAGNPREGVFDREAPKYTQIGNAVPVKLAEAVGLHFRAILAGSRGSMGIPKVG